MSQNKSAYFQGGGGINEPSPGKKKYKIEKAIVIQPRFVEPFYRNYDLYNAEGVDGKPKHGPGAGWNDMHKYKSIKDFVEQHRKHLQGKYVADDSYIEDNAINYKSRVNKMKIRSALFSKIIKMSKDINLIDFPIDDQIESGSIIGDSGSYSDSVPIGGQLDEYLTEKDFEGKGPEQLNFGNDYADQDSKNPKNIDEIMNKYLSPAETDLFGMPDGIDPNSDLDAEVTVNNENPYYGITDSGRQMYEDKWNI